MLRHMWKRVIARRFTDVRAIKLGWGFKLKTKNKTEMNMELTSSTVRGMHILYSFSNIFLG